MTPSGTATRSVPFVSLERHHATIADELRGAFDAVLADGGFVLGREVEAFEREFAAFCGVSHCVGVGSGTAAIAIALLAAGVGEGDEVIVPAHTFVATAFGVLHAGATPVLCDVEEDTGLIDAEAAAALIGDRTAAIVPVHLYGQACDMDALRSLASRHGLLLVEDAAQAHGAGWQGARAGSLGAAAAFSFYPSKNLGALGDGGAICTDDAELAEKARRIRNLGQATKGHHVEAGLTERLDGIQAAALRVKLPRLAGWNRARRNLASLYRRELDGCCRLLGEDPRAECVYHLFPVRVAERDLVRARLSEHGVSTGLHYWPALHRQPPLRGLPSADAPLPSATRWSEEEISLPMFPEMSEAEALAVVDAFRRAVGAAA